MSPSAAVLASSLDKKGNGEQPSVAERIASKIDPKAIFLQRLEAALTPADLVTIKNWETSSTEAKTSVELKTRQALGGITQGAIGVNKGKLELRIDSERGFYGTSIGIVRGIEVLAELSWKDRSAQIAAPTYEADALLERFMFPSQGICIALKDRFQQQEAKAQKLATSIESVSISLARSIRQLLAKECADWSIMYSASNLCQSIDVWAADKKTTPEQKEQLAEMKKIVFQFIREDILESASTRLQPDKNNQTAFNRSCNFHSKATNLAKLAEITDSYDLVPSIMKAIEAETRDRFIDCIQEADQLAAQGTPDLFKLAFEYHSYGCAPDSESARQAMMQGASLALQLPESKSAIHRIVSADMQAKLKAGDTQGVENVLRSLDRFDNPNFGKVVFDAQQEPSYSQASLQFIPTILENFTKTKPDCALEKYFNCARDFVAHCEVRGYKVSKDWKKSFSEHLSDLIADSKEQAPGTLSREQETAYARAGRRLAIGAPLFSESELVLYRPGNYGQKALIFGLAMLGQTPRLSVYDCFYDLINPR